MQNKINYISRNGLNRLISERDNLAQVERPKICELINWAASLGDRSENADYIYGKKRLREIERRMRFLQGRINCAQVIETKNLNLSEIRFGAKIQLVDLSTQLKKEVSILGVDEVNAEQLIISYDSPLGRALIGKKAGDNILVIGADNKRREYLIDSFFYP